MPSEFSGLYDKFLGFLQSGNSLPINSMWFIDLGKIPLANIKNTVKNYEGWDISQSLDNSTNQITNNVQGILIAQGVKVTGESNNVSRVGEKRSGYIQGVVGNGRAEFPMLEIAFLENNLSFVDYCLRPWCIAVSHKSLKDSSLKTTIVVSFLGKTGSNTISPLGLKNDNAPYPPTIRKQVTYYGCCPISINEEEYNYEGADVYRLRQIRFVYSNYVINEVGPNMLTVVNDSTVHDQDQNPDIYTSAEAAFLDTRPAPVASRLRKENKNADTPGFTFSNFAPVQDILRNTAGSIEGLVNSAITRVTSEIGGFENDIVGKVDDVVRQAIDSINIFNPSDRDNPEQPGNYIERGTQTQIDSLQPVTTPFKGRIVNTDDAPDHVAPITEISRTSPAKIDVNKTINQNDAPIAKEVNTQRVFVREPTDPNADTFMMGNPITYRLRSPDVDDARHGEINTEGVKKSINQNDHTKGVQVDRGGRSINQNDMVKSTPTNQGNISINQNDAVKSTPTNQSDRTINQNDAVKSVKTTQGDKTINQDDAVKSVKTTQGERSINQDDHVQSVKSTKGEKSINQNDHVQSVKTTQGDIPIKLNDHLESTPTTKGEIKLKQTPLSSSNIKFIVRQTNTKDTRISDVAPQKPEKTINANDTRTDKKIQYKLKGVELDDTPTF